MSWERHVFFSHGECFWKRAAACSGWWMIETYPYPESRWYSVHSVHDWNSAHVLVIQLYMLISSWESLEMPISHLVNECKSSEFGENKTPKITMFFSGNSSGWWFQTFFIVHNIWDNPSHWRTHIFQRGGSTTNQSSSSPYLAGSFRVNSLEIHRNEDPHFSSRWFLVSFCWSLLQKPWWLGRSPKTRGVMLFFFHLISPFWLVSDGLIPGDEIRIYSQPKRCFGTGWISTTINKR